MDPVWNFLEEDLVFDFEGFIEFEPKAHLRN